MIILSHCQKCRNPITPVKILGNEMYLCSGCDTRFKNLSPSARHKVGKITDCPRCAESSEAPEHCTICYRTGKVFWLICSECNGLGDREIEDYYDDPSGFFPCVCCGGLKAFPYLDPTKKDRVYRWVPSNPYGGSL